MAILYRPPREPECSPPVIEALNITPSQVDRARREINTGCVRVMADWGMVHHQNLRYKPLCRDVCQQLAALGIGEPEPATIDEVFDGEVLPAAQVSYTPPSAPIIEYDGSNVSHVGTQAVQPPAQVVRGPEYFRFDGASRGDPTALDRIWD